MAPESVLNHIFIWCHCVTTTSSDATGEKTFNIDSLGFHVTPALNKKFNYTGDTNDPQILSFPIQWPPNAVNYGETSVVLFIFSLSWIEAVTIVKQYELLLAFWRKQFNCAVFVKLIRQKFLTLQREFCIPFVWIETLFGANLIV